MNKELDYYMSLPYQEVIVHSKEGGYVGYIPDLKGCITQAETRDEIITMLEDAKKSWLEAAISGGIKIPEPLSEIEFSGKFNLRIPKSLHKSLVMGARKEGVSVNQMAMCLIARGLGTSFE